MMEKATFVLQSLFYLVGMGGVILATVNHYWFVRDRNLSNILQITDLLQSSYLEFEAEKVAGNNIRFPLLKLMNSMLMYCTLHNENQIKSATKAIHERFVASTLEYVFENKVSGKYIYKYLGDSHNYDVLRKFINNNSELFTEKVSLLNEIDRVDF